MAVHGVNSDVNIASMPESSAPEEAKKVDSDKEAETVVENKIKIKPKQKPRKKVQPVIGKPYFDIELLQTESKYRDEAAKHFFVFDHTEVKKSQKKG